MISIVICSRKKLVDERFSQNIATTIGCEYEIISIDNSQNQYSIFEAYNLGTARSKGELICFLHDDIFLHTNDWGKVANRIFAENKDAGLLGVAGAKIKTSMPSGWWNCPASLKEINIIQHIDGSKSEKWEFGFKNGSLSEVAVIDGVFMVMRKNSGILFNTTLQGFHNYDLNIAIECKIKGFKVFVTNEILIEHFSNGNINTSWYESTVKLHQIYNQILPITASDFKDFDTLKATEINNSKKIIGQLFGHAYRKQAYHVWRKLWLLDPFAIFHLKFLKRIILAR